MTQEGATEKPIVYKCRHPTKVNAHGARLYRDFYPTDERYIENALRFLPDNFAPEWTLDSGSGTGLWGKAARKLWVDTTLVGVEIRLDMPFKAWYDWNVRADYLRMSSDIPLFDCIIGNPPYKIALDFLRHNWRLLKEGGYMLQLLRLDYLGSQGRYPVFKYEMPLRKVIVCSDRPSFVQGKTDSINYGFFIWQKGYQGVAELDLTLSRTKDIRAKGYNNANIS